MTFDHDLSNISMDEAKLWIYLHIDSFRADILADHAGSQGFHSLQGVQDHYSYREAAQDATGVAGVRGHPWIRDN